MTTVIALLQDTSGQIYNGDTLRGIFTTQEEADEGMRMVREAFHALNGHEPSDGEFWFEIWNLNKIDGNM